MTDSSLIKVVNETEGKPIEKLKVLLLFSTQLSRNIVPGKSLNQLRNNVTKLYESLIHSSSSLTNRCCFV